MRTSHANGRTACALLLACGLAVPVLRAQDLRLDDQRRQVEEAVAAFEADLARPGFTTSTRALTAYAHYAILLGRDPRRAEEAIRRAFKQQRMDPADPLHGHVDWRENKREEKLDKNGIAFTLLPLGAILQRHRDKLTPEFVEEIRPNILAGLAAIKRRDADIAYTNIFLMELADLLLLGDAFRQPEYSAHGLAMLDRWLAHTRANGISEFGSPTYAAVQLASIETAWCHTADPAIKEKLGEALRWLWSDIAANFFAGRGTLSGPHSRSADFARGRGSVERYYQIEGLSRFPAPPPVFTDAYRPWANAVEGGFRPDAAILDLAREPRRVVRQRYGAGPGQDRTNFITPDFALGSTSASYSPDDRQIACELADDDPDFPAIRLIGDSFDSPYGDVKRTTSEGHRKTRHLTNRIAAVQEKGLVLALLDWNAASQGAAETIATNLLLPLDADAFYLDGEKVVPADFHRLAPGPDSVVGVRHGNGVVALRIFAAGGARGTSPLWFLKDDGAPAKAGRFGVYHYRGVEDRVTDRPLRAGVLIAAASCDDEAGAAAFLERVRTAEITQSETGGLWSAAVSLDGTTLEAGLDLGGGARLVRRINGRDVNFPVFEVNGRDLAAELAAPANSGS